MDCGHLDGAREGPHVVAQPVRGRPEAAGSGAVPGAAARPALRYCPRRGRELAGAVAGGTGAGRLCLAVPIPGDLG